MDAETAQLLADYDHAKKVQAYQRAQQARIRKQRIAYIEQVQGYPFGQMAYLMTPDGRYVPKNRRLRDDKESIYVKVKSNRKVQVTREQARRYLPEVWVKTPNGFTYAQNVEGPGPYYIQVEEDKYKRWHPLGVEKPPDIIREWQGISYTLSEWLKSPAVVGMTRAEATVAYEYLPIVYAAPSTILAAEQWAAAGRKLQEKPPVMSAAKAYSTFGENFMTASFERKKELEESPLYVGRYAPLNAPRIEQTVTKPEWFPTRESLRRPYLVTDKRVFTVKPSRRAEEARELAEYLRRYR